MNLQNFNKEGRNYKTEKMRQISPSSKLMHLSNQEISFYVSKYGEAQENSKDSENTKYFMSLIQPLLEENYQLKDTIINLTEALKLDKDLLLETIGSIVKESIVSSQNTISELLDALTLSVNSDRSTLIKQQEEITKRDQIISQLQNIITQNDEWKKLFIVEKDKEVEQRTFNFFEQMKHLQQQHEDSQKQLFDQQKQLCQQQVVNKKLSEEVRNLANDLYNCEQQKSDLQIQLSIAERQIHFEKQESQKRLNDQVSQIHKDHYQQIEQLKIEQLAQINDMKKQIQDLQDEISNIEVSYTASLDKNLQEIKRLQQQCYDADKQLQVYKKQELTNLDNLSKTMIEKRDKDLKLKELHYQLDQKNKELDELKLTVFQEKSRFEQIEAKHQKQAEKHKYNLLLDRQKYKEKTETKIKEVKKELEQKVVVIELEKKKLSEEFKQQIMILDVQKTSLVKECKEDNEKLRDEIEDLEFKLKDLDNMWDFKYAKLKMEYDRLKLELGQQ